VTQTIQGIEQRTDGLWTHTGKFVVLGGPVELPPGSISTDEITPGAVQEQIGSFVQTIAWTLPTSNVWTETPIQLTVPTSGAQLRIEFNVLLGCPTKGQRIFWGIMVDGAAPVLAVGALDSPENNFGMMAVGTYYAAPRPPATYRMAFGVYGPSGSQIFNALASTMYLTEQKR
jgi:hypothetical protein